MNCLNQALRLSCQAASVSFPLLDLRTDCLSGRSGSEVELWGSSGQLPCVGLHTEVLCFEIKLQVDQGPGQLVTPSMGPGQVQKSARDTSRIHTRVSCIRKMIHIERDTKTVLQTRRI